MLLRKVAHIALASLLLLTTTGISLSKHYCMGRLKSVAVFADADHCMGGQDMDPMPCCEDTHEVLKVEDLSVVDVTLDLQPVLFILATIEWSDRLCKPVIREPLLAASDTSPPPDRVVLFENLRI